MPYTIEDVDRVVAGWDDDGYGDGWVYFKHLENEAKSSPLGEIRRVAEHGGEGEGDDYWVVISITDSAGAVRYWKRHGWYQSYGDGGVLDGPTEEVKPVERTVVFYEP